MKSNSRFTVLIERRQFVTRILAILMSTALLAALFGAQHARAQVAFQSKMASDLQPFMTLATGAPLTTSSATTDKVSGKAPPLPAWVKDVKGLRYAKVLIVSNSSDPDLTELREAVLAAGGSVYFRYVSVRALSVLLPTYRIAAIAARSDVQSVSPNRQTARTTSKLEETTGVSTVRRGSGSGASGLDGSGVGIAILDSGIAWNHYSMRAADGKTSRVKAAVDLQLAGDATMVGLKDWTVGVDVSASLYPGSKTMLAYEKQITANGASRSDLYGHGSHVAAIAAGQGAYRSQDSTGVAPNANLYDVKVLDGTGMGQLSDVLAGIDWVIYHAKEYNIRVMNLSLAADSHESYLTDPLCRAVRSAVASGITVVVAAGNFGKNAAGAEVYGSISSPGNDPSVITIGSVNTKGTASRSDDTVNFFSSRGPTRGAYVDTAGVRHVDNLLKPDLVAPGNKVEIGRAHV